MADAPIHSIKVISQGGVANGGHSIWFEAKFNDGTDARFSLPSSAIGKVVGKLMHLGGLAAQEKIKTGGTVTMETSTPFRAKQVDVAHAKGPDGPVIVIRIQTLEHIPIDVAVPRDFAPQLAERLHQVANEQPPFDPQSRN